MVSLVSMLSCDVAHASHLDLYYDGIGTVENMKRIFLHYLHRNTFEALRDLTAQAIGIYGLLPCWRPT